MPNMRIRSKVAVTTQIPIRIMEMVDYIRDEHRIKITNLFEAALERHIEEAYPDAVEAIVESETEEVEAPEED